MEERVAQLVAQQLPILLQQLSSGTSDFANETGQVIENEYRNNLTDLDRVPENAYVSFQEIEQNSVHEKKELIEYYRFTTVIKWDLLLASP